MAAAHGIFKVTWLWRKAILMGRRVCESDSPGSQLGGCTRASRKWNRNGKNASWTMAWLAVFLFEVIDDVKSSGWSLSSASCQTRWADEAAGFVVLWVLRLHDATAPHRREGRGRWECDLGERSQTQRQLEKKEDIMLSFHVLAQHVPFSSRQGQLLITHPAPDSPAPPLSWPLPFIPLHKWTILQ